MSMLLSDLLELTKYYTFNDFEILVTGKSIVEEDIYIDLQKGTIDISPQD